METAACEEVAPVSSVGKLNQIGQTISYSEAVQNSWKNNWKELAHPSVACTPKYPSAQPRAHAVTVGV